MVAYSSFTSAALNPEATLTDGATVSWNALTQPVAKVTLGVTEQWRLQLVGR